MSEGTIKKQHPLLNELTEGRKKIKLSFVSPITGTKTSVIVPDCVLSWISIKSMKKYGVLVEATCGEVKE